MYFQRILNSFNLLLSAETEQQHVFAVKELPEVVFLCKILLYVFKFTLHLVNEAFAIFFFELK